MFEAEKMASQLTRHHRPGHHGNKTNPRPSPKDTGSQTPEPPKLRASCDGCYLSKVKCSKETPRCSRWYASSDLYTIHLLKVYASAEMLTPETPTAWAMELHASLFPKKNQKQTATKYEPRRYRPSQRVGKPRRLQPEGGGQDFHFYRPELEFTKQRGGRSPVNVQTPLLDWNVEPSIGNRTPDTHSSSSNDNRTSWQPIFTNGLSDNFPQPHSNLEDSVFQQLMSPVESIGTFWRTNSASTSPNG